MHAPVKRRSQHADCSMGFAPQRKFGPAISEAAEPRCATPSAIKLPDTIAGLRRGLARILFSSIEIGVLSVSLRKVRGLSSVGRAPQWH